jgi:hypothetical protein
MYNHVWCTWILSLYPSVKGYLEQLHHIVLHNKDQMLYHIINDITYMLINQSVFI